MVSNGQKLNQDKTELLPISSRYHQSPVFSYLQVGDEKICPNESKRNLGVYFDQHAIMHIHVKKVCQAAYYHLQDLSKIRRYLSQDTNQILIYPYITFKLDNCTSLLYGLPTYMTNNLQTVQNATARIVTFTKKTDQINPSQKGSGEFSTVMQTLDFVSGLHNCLEFSQPLECLYQAMQTQQKKVFYCFYKITSSKNYNAGKDKNSFY